MGKRSESGLNVKSIWDELALSECGLSKTQRNRLWAYAKKNMDTPLTIQQVPLEEKHFSIKNVAIKTLRQSFATFTLNIVETIGNRRDDTTKLLLELQDGHRIESVIIRHKQYATLCVSSQIGCAMGCKFCATGNTSMSLPWVTYNTTGMF